MKFPLSSKNIILGILVLFFVGLIAISWFKSNPLEGMTVNPPTPTKKDNPPNVKVTTPNATTPNATTTPKATTTPNKRPF
jgi:hypothetical protein